MRVWLDFCCGAYLISIRYELLWSVFLWSASFDQIQPHPPQAVPLPQRGRLSEVARFRFTTQRGRLREVPRFRFAIQRGRLKGLLADFHGDTVDLDALGCLDHDILLAADGLGGDEVLLILFDRDLDVGHDDVELVCV